MSRVFAYLFALFSERRPDDACEPDDTPEDDVWARLHPLHFAFGGAEGDEEGRVC